MEKSLRELIDVGQGVGGMRSLKAAPVLYKLSTWIVHAPGLTVAITARAKPRIRRFKPVPANPHEVVGPVLRASV